MPDAVNPWLSPWESFYVIVGSAAAALTGLQFVVMALVADVDRTGSTATVDAFGTPTVVHFCMTLFVAGVLSAPWGGLAGPRAVLLAAGLGGIVYAAVVARRARRQRGYTPVLEDWIWHAWLPALAYAILVIAAARLAHEPAAALFGIAAAALLLVFVGIHNAWDSVSYVAVIRTRGETVTDVPRAPDAKPTRRPKSMRQRR